MLSFLSCVLRSTPGPEPDWGCVGRGRGRFCGVWFATPRMPHAVTQGCDCGVGVGIGAAAQTKSRDLHAPNRSNTRQEAP